MINNKDYWNKWFKSSDGDSHKGCKPVSYQILLENIPGWLKEEIFEDKMTIGDLGCGMGGGTYMLKQQFKDSQVLGVDFSDYAVEMARNKYTDVSFFCSDIKDFKEHYDVLILSHVLEYFENPSEIFDYIINLADKYFILVTPFREEDLPKDHLNSFNYDFFPINIHNHELIHYKEMEIFDPGSCEVGEHLLVIYANKSNIDMGKFTLDELNNSRFDEFKLAQKNYENKISSLEELKEKFEDLSRKTESNLAETQLKIEYLTKLSDKRLSQYLKEQDKLLNQKNLVRELLRQNTSLREMLERYKSRRVVRAANRILEIRESLKSYLKRGPNARLKIQKPISTEFSSGKLKRMKDIKVAVILDEFSFNCFKYEFNAIPVEPTNWLEIFEREKPDLFLCESAWSGVDPERKPWIGKIHSNPKNNRENRTDLFDILRYCNENGITTIFWNKEDPVHHDQHYNFVDTALRFDHIFTTAEECISSYQGYGHRSVHYLMFAGQPNLFNPIEEGERSDDVIFAGGWQSHHMERCKEMEAIFDNILESGYELKIYDRYSSMDPDRLYPDKFQEFLNPGVSYHEIAKVYKESKYALNINTITNSRTMFARRVFELMLCNTFLLSNYSLGMHSLFGDNVVFVDKNNQLDLDIPDKMRINNLYGVLKNHTYTKRFEQILNTINFGYIQDNKDVTLYYTVNNPYEVDDIMEHFGSVTYDHKALVLLLSPEIPDHLVKNIYQRYAGDEVSVYSIHYLLKEEAKTPGHLPPNGSLNMDESISNKAPYFIFADLKLQKDFVEDAILHYSYIDGEVGIRQGNKFTFDQKVEDINNVLLPDENFIKAFNNLFNEGSNEFTVYDIQTPSAVENP